jgi:NAD(P)-dependent dehydrogenase (short-subunit alcohol dehydrogenase family)
MGLSESKPSDIPIKYFDDYFQSSLSPSCFHGKTIAITGSTSGTGYELAEICVRNGVETVLLLNRPSERATATQSKLSEIATAVATTTSSRTIPNDGSTDTKPMKTSVVETIPCDLQDFDSVRQAAVTIKAKYEAIDVLCNNAGVMAMPDQATKDGYDIQMQTNHLSHFILTKELFPLLQRAAELRGEARIVNHSSGARLTGGPLKETYFGKNGGNLGGDSTSFFGGARWERYHQSKLANSAFTMELAHRINQNPESTKGIKSVVVAPGLSATNLQLASAAEGAMNAMTTKLLLKMAQSAKDGTLPLLAGCFDPTTQNGDFWEPAYMSHVYGPPVKVPYDKNSSDEGQRTMLWKTSEEACGEFKI